MALKKHLTFENGVSADYHRISMIRVMNQDGENFEVCCGVDSYTDASFRNADLRHRVHSAMYPFKLDKSLLNRNALFDVLYNKLKSKEIFKDAEDV